MELILDLKDILYRSMRKSYYNDVLVDISKNSITYEMRKMCGDSE